jgi:hypothetical protein
MMTLRERYVRALLWIGHRIMRPARVSWQGYWIEGGSGAPTNASLRTTSEPLRTHENG